MLRSGLGTTAAALTLAMGLGLLAPGQSASAASTVDEPSPTTSGAYSWRDDHPVVISEVASGWADHPEAGFVELTNVSDAEVELRGWNLYACNAEGLRAKRASPYTELSGVVLQPGETYLVGRVGVEYGGRTPDDVLTSSPSARGLGFVLEDPERRIADSVGVYSTTPWMTTSECAPQGSLPNTLDVLAGESWQRFGATPTAQGQWRVALASPGEVNSFASPEARGDSGVVISELAPFGPNGSGDDIVEVRNDGAAAVELEGWQLWRCTATGQRTSDTLQLTFGARHSLAPGERLVVAGPDSSIPNPDATMRVSLADTAFGVQLRDARGALVDEQAVAHQADSACQSSAEKLPARLDPVRGESWQRAELTSGGAEWVIAPRTAARANADHADSLADQRPVVLGSAAAYQVVVSELATDPLDVDALTAPHNFVELTNRGDAVADVSGWKVWGCDDRGLRRIAPLATLSDSTSLASGESIVIAADGTAAARSASYTYSQPLHFLGAGVLVENARGEIVDRLGVYHQTEMDESVEPFSVCTNELSLVTFQPDRLRGETFHRVSVTGIDLDDVVTRTASVGSDSALARPHLLVDEPRARMLAATAAFAEARALARVAALAVDGGDEQSSTAVSLLSTRQPTEATASGFDTVELRVPLDEPVSGAVTWSGTAPARHRVTLSVESADGSWSEVAAAVADADGDVTLTATVDEVDALLVRAVTEPRAADDLEPDGGFEPLDRIDGTIVHLTDTQYLSEAYPEEYDAIAEWIVELSERRELAAVVHTGDLVQGWVDPDQSEPRARVEFERASRAQSILEQAGLVATVLPGNHDTKRGIDTELYNEFFGPDRLARTPGEQVPIAADDATSSYVLVNVGPAPMLVLSLGYGYGERELTWAEAVVRAHPDRNVIVATHEHLTPLTELDPARRATANRWLSSGDQLWERVVAPHANVVAVLSGHYHGLGAIVTENAGGIEGHNVVEILADYQEFRTATGERATGFLRLLQWDLASGMLLVDTYSPRLDTSVSAPFDSPQFVLETGHADRPANGRPWNIVALGPEGRYGVDDDEFAVPLALQYDKTLTMTSLELTAPAQSEASIEVDSQLL